MNIIYEINERRGPTLEQFMTLRKQNLFSDQREEILPKVFSLLSIGSNRSNQQGGEQKSFQNKNTFDFIDPCLLKFQDAEFERIYHFSRFKEIIWWSKILLKLRALYIIFVGYDVNVCIG